KAKADTKSTSDTKSTTDTKSSTSTDAASTGKSSKERAASEHSISYFSSISTDEYRAGWDSIFGNQKKTAPQTPTTITLAYDELDEELRTGLARAFRQKAAAQNLDATSPDASSRTDWRLQCTFTPDR
ncbi:MAG: hypothetical protein ACC634_02370, partial [Hyphomicrobiales bacterium]